MSRSGLPRFTGRRSAEGGRIGRKVKVPVKFSLAFPSPRLCVSAREKIWAGVETLATTRLPKNYDYAVQHLGDLRDLAEVEGNQADFKKRLTRFRNQHFAKTSLLDLLANGGM
jgi:hypothetical protein